jgi:hypothetical protein
MKKNMGNSDKIIRISMALIIIILFSFDLISGTLNYVFLGVAVIFALTSFISFCPLYTLLGINTQPKKKE